ncbi:MAG: 3-oxoacyl-ACP reductase FabG [Bryobacterales bacterium]|nr:3-oxoacyl-ACP reductase FabG [Bryobacterales bacterium]
MSLKGKAALVTGASKGVGKGIALQLAAGGARVAVNYHSDAAGAAATVAEITSAGGEAFAVQASVAAAFEVHRMFKEVASRFGRLDIHVNNAGVQTWKPMLELTEQEWDLVLDTNLKGCFLCTQQAALLMKDSDGGAVINIGSGCNKAPFPNLASYTASKGAIEMFTKVAAVELGPYKIRVNCVAPGAIEIERTRRELGDYAGTWAALTPMGRVGHPVDIGRVVAFLAGDGAEFITGQTVWVDGGLFTRPAWPYPMGG